jgi:ABC-type bacteriocin/lantibiotic exporter with double-glycine peptidase domain
MAFSFLLNGQLNENVMNIVGVAVVVCGAIAIMTDTLTLGEFVAFYAAAGLLNGQLGTLTNGLPEILSGNESLSKLHSFHATSAPEAYQNIGHVDFTGSIELRDLSFGYDASPLLKNVNLRIRPSETILITGKNGSGKSTILNLIMGFWKPGKGGLFADGARYDELDIVKLRRDIGYVSQRPEIFPGTVRENICYGQENFDEPTVTSAALQADAKDFIALLTEGYDTQVGDEGTRLSGGQCQKIAIARALMRKPALLLLDEPTNHLDAEAVTRILTDLRISHPEMAVVVVSHDPVIHCYADRVLILHGGDLEEVVE